MQAFKIPLVLPLYIENHSDKLEVYLKVLAMTMITFHS